jgi:hypothetical protein
MIYGNGAAMGFTPAQIDQMSPWQFAACVAGHNRANGVEPKAAPPSPEEHRARLDRTRNR